MESENQNSKQIAGLADNLITKVRKSLEAAKRVRKTKKREGSIQDKCDN